MCMKPGAKLSARSDKYERYKHAFGRVKAARNGGFYVEAIMILESVITDRLMSAFVKHQATAPEAVLNVLSTAQGSVPYVSTKRLVDAFESHLFNAEDERFAGLPQRMRTWLKDRNRAAHAFVKSHPFDMRYEEPLDEFLARLEETAAEGEAVARLLDKWVSQTNPTRIKQE